MTSKEKEKKSLRSALGDLHSHFFHFSFFFNVFFFISIGNVFFFIQSLWLTDIFLWSCGGGGSYGSGGGGGSCGSGGSGGDSSCNALVSQSLSLKRSRLGCVIKVFYLVSASISRPEVLGGWGGSVGEEWEEVLGR